MISHLNTWEAILATVLTGLLMFFLRYLPFLIFHKKEPSAYFNFAGKYIPVIAIAVLFAACLADKTTNLIFLSGDSSGSYSFGSVISGFLGAGACIALHLWKKNPMISIFGGTILYMLLNYFLKNL